MATLISVTVLTCMVKSPLTNLGRGMTKRREAYLCLIHSKMLPKSAQGMVLYCASKDNSDDPHAIMSLVIFRIDCVVSSQRPSKGIQINRCKPIRRTSASLDRPRQHDRETAAMTNTIKVNKGSNLVEKNACREYIHYTQAFVLQVRMCDMVFKSHGIPG